MVGCRVFKFHIADDVTIVREKCFKVIDVSCDCSGGYMVLIGK